MLTKEEITTIKGWLHPHLAATKAYEELLDHACSAIEHYMITGYAFTDAFAQVQEEFAPEDFAAIRTTEKRIKIKRTLMMGSPFLLLTAWVFLFTLNSSKPHQPWQLPLKQDNKVRMASGFGYRVHPLYKTRKLHTGMDFLAPTGTPIHPVLDGKVTKVVESKTGYGKHIEVTHNDSLVTRYAHMHEIKVRVGDMVRVVDTIGTVGSTGTSTASHLHFEVLLHQKKINPTRMDSVFHF